MRRLAILVLLAACKTIPNPDYCTSPADCADNSGQHFCDVDGTYGLANSCIPDPATCSTDRPCEIAGLPACVAGTCEQCSEASHCAGISGLPVCGMGNLCVECTSDATCSGAEPICNLATETCRGCQADGECPTGFCNKSSGACVVESDLIFVSMSGSGTLCTRGQPCGTIQNALNAVIGTHDIVVLQAGAYSGTFTIQDFDVTIKAQGAVTVTGTTANQPVFSVSGNKPVRIEGITIQGATGDANAVGVRCTGVGGQAALTIDGATITGNASHGVLSTQCVTTLTQATLADNTGLGVSAVMSELVVRRSKISSNDAGGIRLEDSDFDIENTFVSQNGIDGTSTTGGVHLVDDPPGGASGARFEHNTVAFNVAMGGVNEGFHCGSVSTQLLFPNNIVFGNNVDVAATSGACTWRNTASNIVLPGVSNVTSNPKFVSGTDFHLDLGSPCVNAAVAGSVNTDFDGQPRPAGGGPDIGADELQ